MLQCISLNTEHDVNFLKFSNEICRLEFTYSEWHLLGLNWPGLGTVSGRVTKKSSCNRVCALFRLHESRLANILVFFFFLCAASSSSKMDVMAVTYYSSSTLLSPRK